MGGRGGNSGLDSNGAGKLPSLEGSEKQVSWAEDIRKSKIEKYTYEKLMSEQGVLSHSRIITGMEILTGNDIETRGYGETKREKMLKSFNDEYRKINPIPPYGTPERKEWKNKHDTAESKVNQEYKKWLWNEFKKLTKTQKSAKWWIDNRRY